jgi:hypothetical protein
MRRFARDVMPEVKTIDVTARAPAPAPVPPATALDVGLLGT